MTQIWSDRIIHYLAGLPLLNGLSGDDIAMLLNWLDARADFYKPEQVICRTGRIINSLFIPLPSELDRNRRRGRGRGAVGHVLTEPFGDIENAWGNGRSTEPFFPNPWPQDRYHLLLRPPIIGIVPGLLVGIAASQTITTAKEMTLLAINTTNLLTKTVLSGRLAYSMQIFLLNRLNLLDIVNDYCQKQMMIRKHISLRARLATFLVYCSNDCGNVFTLNGGRQALADFLGVSRPTMSRELATLQNEGLLSYYLDSFVLSDVKALEKLAESTGRFAK